MKALVLKKKIQVPESFTDLVSLDRTGLTFRKKKISTEEYLMVGTYLVSVHAAFPLLIGDWLVSMSHVDGIGIDHVDVDEKTEDTTFDDNIYDQMEKLTGYSKRETVNLGG